jgi:hypothetical protein
MSRDRAARVDGVQRLVAAARQLKADHASIAPSIARETGLSPAGVELAFARHLETDPRDEDVEALVDGAGDAPHVAVILSANVFVAALRALAIARAASGSVVVRASRRAPTFAGALVACAADPSIRLDPDLDVALLPPGEVHVYGRDETIAAVRARARANAALRVVGHGAGMGVALVSAGADLSSAAASLAEDVVAFDQRGCLSPRIALVVGDAARAAAFARALDDALDDAARRIPRGPLDDAERAASTRYVTTMAFAGHVHTAHTHAVGVGRAGAPLTLPPPGRHVHVVPVEGPYAARALLVPLERFVVTVGSDDPALAGALAPTHARLAALGEMQRPPMDGPVDRRPG